MLQKTTQFATEMQQLDALVARLGGAAEEQLSRAIDAMEARDTEAADAVIAEDRALDAMEAEIDRHVALTFTRRQPMASDLRVVLSSVKIASAMERVGDLAKNTARRSKLLVERPALRLVGPIVRFGRETLDLFSASLEGYVQRDAEMAAAVWVQDERLDHTYNTLMREITAAMADMPDAIPLYTQLMFIAKNMERIGDHATFIAEMVHFIVTGAPLTEDRPKGPPDGVPLGDAARHAS